VIKTKESSFVNILESGYVINRFEEKIPEIKNININSFITSFYFRKNYFSNNSSTKKSFDFFDVSDIHIHSSSTDNIDTIFVDFKDVFSKELLFTIPKEHSNSWFMVKIFVSEIDVSISIYSVKKNVISTALNTIRTKFGDRFKLKNFIADKIIADCHNSLFEIHTIRFDVNDNEFVLDAQLPSMDMFSYNYAETSNFTDDEIKSSGATEYFNINNEGLKNHIEPIFYQSRTILSGENNCSFLSYKL
jgi:hypothetical protein